MGSVTTLASRRIDPALSIEFDDVGDFAAYDRATKYLEARGFSVGTMQAGSPTGILLGDVKISKWRNLSAEEQNDCHGQITADSFRSGPVTISIRPDAPSSVIEAFRSVPELVEAEATVIDPPGVFVDEHPEDRNARLHVEGRRATTEPKA